MVKPFLSYSEKDNKLTVVFDYDPNKVDEVRHIPGRRFVPKDKGGPAWRFPATLSNARQARSIFGMDMQLSPECRKWAMREVQEERNIASVHGADSAELSILPTANPELYRLIAERPYQLADVAFMGMTSCINANQPSLGKTIETIGAMYESGLVGGVHLIVAPITAMKDTWARHLWKWMKGVEVIIAHGKTRDWAIDDALKADSDIVVITNPDTVRRCGDRLATREWATITIDEYHLAGLASPKNSGGGRGTAFFKAVNELRAERKWALSGTPIGGRPIRLWPAFHWLFPDRFTSKWAWAGKWLDVEDVRTGRGQYATAKKAGGIREGNEDKFYKEHSKMLIRRTKAEVRKELPPKVHVDVWCEMTAGQKKMYDAMATETEVRIDEEHLTATNVLALYTRLKQFANARQTIRPSGKVDRYGYQIPILTPTSDSGKLPMLVEKLAERGITKEPEGDTQVIIGTQFRTWAEEVYRHLVEDVGVPARLVGLISGKTRPDDRSMLVDRFEREHSLRVLIIVTKAGGTSLNLDSAESIHIMDETWNPDDQEQLSDRGHRFTGVTIYTYRTSKSIEEYINNVGINKRRINEIILDLRREGAIHG